MNKDQKENYKELKRRLTRLLSDLVVDIVEEVDDVLDIGEPYVALGMNKNSPELYVSMTDDESMSGYLSWVKFCQHALDSDPEWLEYWAPKLEELAKKMREARAEYGDEL